MYPSHDEIAQKHVQIHQFTLIIVDECHHAVELSPLAQLMEIYLLEKLESSQANLPQVIGITASLGAGKNRPGSLSKTFEHQLGICAILDATSGIKTVSQYHAELKSYTSTPECSTILLEPRNPDEDFIRIITTAMQDLEMKLEVRPPSRKMNSFHYKQWAEKSVVEQQSSMVCQRDQISILDYLLVYTRTLITYEDFCYENAIDILNSFHPISDDKATEVERALNQSLSGLQNDLQYATRVANPLLAGVEKILLEKFSSFPGSKGIFFVREIKHTEYVTKWIENSPSLKERIKVSPITGYSHGPSEQKYVMESFRSDVYNLLIATSVLEEGIDVPDCNFVIRFQHFTNEVAELQARGRARAEDSTVYTVTSSDSRQKYRHLIQEEKLKIAEKAIDCFPTEKLKLASTIKDRQEEIISNYHERERVAAERRKRWNTSDVEVQCSKCFVVACKASDIFTFSTGAKPHYVAPDKSFEMKFTTKKQDIKDIPGGMKKLYKVHCKICDKEWGTIIRWKTLGLEFPVLKCKNFRFECNGDIECVKQWKKVPFELKKLPEEYKQITVNEQTEENSQ